MANKSEPVLCVIVLNAQNVPKDKQKDNDPYVQLKFRGLFFL